MRGIRASEAWSASLKQRAPITGWPLMVEDLPVLVCGHEPDARAVEVDSGIPRTVDILSFGHEFSCVI